MAFNWFRPWKWFESKERDELEELKQKIEFLEKNLTPRQEVEQGKPYKQIFFSSPNMITIIFHSGEVIMRADSNIEEFEFIRDFSTSEAQIKEKLTRFQPIPKEEEMNFPVDEEEDDLADIEELEVPQHLEHKFAKASDIILSDSDFKKKDEDFYLLDIPLSIPPVVLGSFVELFEKKTQSDQHEEFDEKINSLKMFWGWLALNPIADARRDALRFILKNNITIDQNGLLVMYRRVVALKHKTDMEFNEFVTSNYLKVKKNKKSPKNYWVGLVDDEYVLLKKEEEDNIGNLAELYEGLKTSDANIYTDNHTRKKEIRIGHIYREDEDKIDLNNKIECSRGLHVGSINFGFNGFGDTGVVALVNPMKIRSVPLYDNSKMRVSEMFIAGAYPFDEYKQDVIEGKVLSFSSEYCNSSLKELNEAVKDKELERLAPKKVKVEVTVKQAKDVSTFLTSRIKQLS